MSHDETRPCRAQRARGRLSVSLVWKPKGRRFLNRHPEAKAPTQQADRGRSPERRQQHCQPVTGVCARVRVRSAADLCVRVRS